MDVSKGLYVCIKRTDAFYTVMDKPATLLVSDCYKSDNKGLGPDF